MSEWKTRFRSKLKTKWSRSSTSPSELVAKPTVSLDSSASTRGSTKGHRVAKVTTKPVDPEPDSPSSPAQTHSTTTDVSPPPLDSTTVAVSPPPLDATTVAVSPPPLDATTVDVSPPPLDATTVAVSPPPLDATTVDVSPPPPVTQAAILADGSSSTNADVWARAYTILGDREPEILQNYETYLNSLRQDPSADGVIYEPRAAKDVIARLLEDRESKQWRFWGTEMKIRGAAEKLVKIAIWANPIVKDAVSAQPYAALAWSGVSMLLPLLAKNTTQNEAMIQGLAEIANLQVYWRVSEKTYLSKSTVGAYQELLDPLAKVYSYIVEYHARVVCHLYKPASHRAWKNIAGNGWSVEKIKLCSGDCEKLINPLQQGALRKAWEDQLKEIQESKEILREIGQIMQEGYEQQQQHYRDEKEEKLFELLASDYKMSKDFNPDRVAGTCEWFFKDDRFTQWRDGNASTVLKVAAGPGCGKSTLSKALIDEYRLSTSVTTSTVGYFFFKAGDERRERHTDALGAIIHQILTQDPTGELIQGALPAFRNFGTSLSSNFPELWKIFEQCTEQSDALNLIFVLDALDECREGGEGLIRKIEQLCDERNKASTGLPNVKFLITTRPYDEQDSFFQTESGSAAYIAFDGDEKSEEIGREIDLVIDSKVESIARELRKEDRDAIAMRLKAMENRTYLWLHLTLQIIEKRKSKYRHRVAIEKLLDKLPAEVSGAYENILCKTEDEDETKTLFRIILASRRPLSLREADVAFKLAQAEYGLDSPKSHDELTKLCDPSETHLPSLIKNLSGLFINVYDSHLFFIHKTARDFLLHQERQGDWQGHFNMPESHGTLSRICIRYLLLPDMDVPSLQVYNTSMDVWDSSARAACEQRYPLWSYTSRLWAAHYKRQKSFTDEQTRQDARKLCDLTKIQTSNWQIGRGCKSPQSYYKYDIIVASELGLHLVVQDMLQNEGSTKMPVRDYLRAVKLASRTFETKTVEILLRYAADDELRQACLDASVNGALGGGSLAFPEALLCRDANANLPKNSTNLPLPVQTRDRGQVETLRMLFGQGARVKFQDERSQTPLHWAAYYSEELTNILLDNGADANAPDINGRTPLLQAAWCGCAGIVRLLCAHGADTNIQDKEGVTALYEASARGHRDVVKILIDNGANVNGQDGALDSPLAVASRGGHLEMVEMLLSKGANPNCADPSCGAPLQAAVGSDHLEIAQRLLDHGADVNTAGGFFTSALLAAVERGHSEFAVKLLDKGADVQIRDEWGYTALHKAADKGNTTLVRIFLASSTDADVDTQSQDNGTALVLAAEQGHIEVVKLLLETCSKQPGRIRDSDYSLALEKAITEEEDEVVQFLRDWKNE